MFDRGMGIPSSRNLQVALILRRLKPAATWNDTLVLMNAEIISVGTEILLGQILDANAAYLARRLAEYGFNVRYKTTIGDDITALRTALQITTERADFI